MARRSPLTRLHAILSLCMESSRVNPPSIAQRLDVLKGHLLDMHKTDHHVGDLDTGVVDVVLDLYAITGRLQNAHKRVAKHRVPLLAGVAALAGAITQEVKK